MSRAIRNPDGTVSHRCFFCGGCAHPSTGHAYAPDVLACWRCTEETLRWLSGWTNRKGKRNGPAFYGAIERTRELMAQKTNAAPA